MCISYKIIFVQIFIFLESIFSENIKKEFTDTELVVFSYQNVNKRLFLSEKKDLLFKESNLLNVKEEIFKFINNGNNSYLINLDDKNICYFDTTETIKPCKKHHGLESWEIVHKEDGFLIKSKFRSKIFPLLRKCLSVDSTEDVKTKTYKVKPAKCNAKDKNQIFNFQRYFDSISEVPTTKKSSNYTHESYYTTNVSSSTNKLQSPDSTQNSSFINNFQTNGIKTYKPFQSKSYIDNLIRINNSIASEVAKNNQANHIDTYFYESEVPTQYPPTHAIPQYTPPKHTPLPYTQPDIHLSHKEIPHSHQPYHNHSSYPSQSFYANISSIESLCTSHPSICK
ncbi:hypothetical protein CWI39_2440p0010 [Hamiltosporidium magnivora]|uniref:Ricin B lectin domain-containing protein n=1 Tax=Hamiltosporidium magnivora TaxID=148818 RepID=A0A4Q9KUC1_9MICR|nr:hypothetical protein CWI39_2440p0010 [Hamiltosporidium magnivora]